MNDSSKLPSHVGTLTKRPSTLSKDDYLSVYGGIYEDSPWIAEAAWASNGSSDLDTAKALHTALKHVVERASQEKKLELIRAHPDLAVRAIEESNLSSASRSEQSGAGLDSCTAQELEDFQVLNTAYKNKFGFPFVLAIKGKDRREILAAFRKRLKNDLDTEFETALQEIHKIAYLRLSALAD